MLKMTDNKYWARFAPKLHSRVEMTEIESKRFSQCFGAKNKSQALPFPYFLPLLP